MEHARILNKILPKLYVVKFKKKLKMFIFNKLLKLIKEKKMKKQNFLVLSIFIITILLSGCIEDEDSTTTENDYFISITPEEQNVKICEEAAQQYYETHTYVGNDVFDCDNMAIDVWNILKTKGINAEIAVGNVDLDEYDIDDWNHAWIMAEVAPNKWLAIECTGGYIVYKEDNPRYYYAHFFKNPKSLKDFNQLYRNYQIQLIEYNKAVYFYNALVEEYNSGDYYTKLYLQSGLEVAKLEMEEKARNLETTFVKLEAILEYG